MSESIYKKTSFDIYKDKLENYVTGDLRSRITITAMINHNKISTDNHSNTKPRYDATASDSDKKMWEFEAK